MRYSFEEAVDGLLEAVSHAEVDPLRRVSENIFLGQLPRLGSGCFDPLLDSGGILRQGVEVSLSIGSGTCPVMFFGSAATPISGMRLQMTFWNQAATPAYAFVWPPGL